MTRQIHCTLAQKLPDWQLSICYLVSYREHGLLEHENLLKQDFSASGPSAYYLKTVI